MKGEDYFDSGGKMTVSQIRDRLEGILADLTYEKPEDKHDQ